MTESKEYTLAEIADHTDSIVVGDSGAIVNNLSTLEKASSESLSFLSNSKYSKFISSSKAQAIIVHDSFDIKDKRNYLVTSDPYLAYAKASSLFKKYVFELDNASIHPSATISNDSSIGENVSIGANVVIGPNCNIGDNVIIKSNCSIVQDVTIGENSIIHNGTVLGSDGFGYAPTKTGYVKIEQIGKLLIKKNVGQPPPGPLTPSAHTPPGPPSRPNASPTQNILFLIPLKIYRRVETVLENRESWSTKNQNVKFSVCLRSVSFKKKCT